jgi:hypothetical protein
MVNSWEWGEGGYPAYESISVGRCKPELVIDLPVELWLPRAIIWAQALHAMQYFIFEQTLE